MPTEIEHKYLVDESLWKNITPGKSVQVRQAYLLTDPDKTIRVRTKGEKGFITIKGRTTGASRPEFEYEIPLDEANELISRFCSNLIEKTRHYVAHEGKLWEVDVFEGLNAGLIVAEIELGSEEELYAKPVWVGMNVTRDAKYANSNLTMKPYSTW